MAETATPTASTATAIRTHDLRELGLATVTKRLNASVANLDVVYVARARSDLTKCPYCPVLHRVEG